MLGPISASRTSNLILNNSLDLLRFSEEFPDGVVDVADEQQDRTQVEYQARNRQIAMRAEDVHQETNRRRDVWSAQVRDAQCARSREHVVERRVIEVDVAI